MTDSTYELPVENIALYLQTEGWSLVSDNRVVYAFEGFEDADGEPLEIILPKNIEAPDYSNYVRNTVSLVSALTEKAASTVANEIKLFDRDILKLNVECDPVDFAALQIPRIKGLIGHAANSEQDVMPCFSRYSRAAKRMVKHFQLNCTQNGNFGYHVESRVGELIPYQMSLPIDKPQVKLPAKLPMQRRIMERIATGLKTAEIAANAGDAQPIIDGYADGFNANMCDAVVKLSKMQQEPMQISLRWSKKIAASKGLKAVKCFQIERRHSDYLKHASDQLRGLKPEFQVIRGLVVGLSSMGDPQSDDVDARSIIVLWEHGHGQPRKLRINLGKSDYLKAHRAHLDWATISVEGIALKRRLGWELADPQEFRILP